MLEEATRHLKVFLCHASEDKPVVRELAQRLFKEGWIDPWLDEKKLLLGQDWRVKIEEAVETSDIVIICVSSNSVSKEGFVQKELRYAREIALEKPDETIFLIPVRIEDCETPRSLRLYQWCDYFGERKEANYDLLLQSLKLCYQQKLMREEYARNRQERGVYESVLLEEKKYANEGEDENIRAKLARNGINAVDKIKATSDVEILKPLSVSKSIFPRAISLFSVGGIIFIILWLLLSTILNPSPSSPTQALNSGREPINMVTFTSLPKSPTVAPGPTATQTASLTPLPTEIADARGVTMRLIQAGEFIMGVNADDALVQCPSCDRNFFVDAEPPHLVYLDSFYIDKYEVTNTFYKTCVDSGVCEPPQAIDSSTHSRYYGNTRFDNYPVIHVNWYQAKTYCEWRNARLPTEAEWEKAARSVDGRIYPWGDSNPSSDLLNFNNWDGDTAEVGTYEKGKSIYGVYDMAGNVAEWVADWYDPLYYKTLDELVSNPKGPDTGSSRVTRGGSFGFFWYTIRSTFRINRAPNLGMTDTGFRCARN